MSQHPISEFAERIDLRSIVADAIDAHIEYHAALPDDHDNLSEKYPPGWGPAINAIGAAYEAFVEEWGHVYPGLVLHLPIPLYSVLAEAAALAIAQHDPNDAQTDRLTNNKGNT